LMPLPYQLSFAIEDKRFCSADRVIIWSKLEHYANRDSFSLPDGMRIPNSARFYFSASM
jgi:hypothetical protein